MIRRSRGRSAVMNDNKNEKSVEELADEALDTVTGGKRTLQVRPAPIPLPVPASKTTDEQP